MVASYCTTRSMYADGEGGIVKVIDHAGNSIKPGRMLRWIVPNGQGVDCYVKVKDVVPPTEQAPGKIVVELVFGIQHIDRTVKGKDAIRFNDLVTVFDPEEELRAEAALNRAVGA